jgi:nicotinamide-nucleotide amidase
MEFTMKNQSPAPTVALLATGNEIQIGDILNSNAQEIAKYFSNAKILVGMHIVTGDQIEEIEKAITFLLASHSAIVITGGLGPTSDDLTRYALARALKRELIFNDQAWDAIIQRLQKIGFNNIPETNRRQAYFPENCEIIPNHNGTAAGCIIEQNGKWICMLPGPPFECLPMVTDIVLPYLKKLLFPQEFYFQKWLLFNVSEGQIAEELDALIASSRCETAYRIAYPYVEFKLSSKNMTDFQKQVPKVNAIVKPYILGDGSKYASEILKEKLMTLHTPLKISDFATGGLLESTLKTPDTFSHIQFVHEPHSDIEIYGLNEFWENKTATETSLKLIFKKNNTIETITKNIPFRGTRVKQFAVECIAREILQKF